MTEEVNESQKTVVSFIAGLIVGALLLWMFGGTAKDDMATVGSEVEEDAAEMVDDMEDAADEVEDMTDDTAGEVREEVANLEVGDAQVSFAPPSRDGHLDHLHLEGVTFPTDAGWIAVRSYNDGAYGNVLGASRYSKEQGLIPEDIELLTPMTAGGTYAIVFFSENGDRQFNMRSDMQLDVAPTTFTVE